jgi:hypothetical protein
MRANKRVKMAYFICLLLLNRPQPLIGSPSTHLTNPPTQPIQSKLQIRCSHPFSTTFSRFQPFSASYGWPLLSTTRLMLVCVAMEAKVEGINNQKGTDTFGINGHRPFTIPSFGTIGCYWGWGCYWVLLGAIGCYWGWRESEWARVKSRIGA